MSKLRRRVFAVSLLAVGCGGDSTEPPLGLAHDVRVFAVTRVRRAIQASPIR
jgi:hypothetical protein